MKDIIVTVFTPTHNRGYIISKCYESLCAQSCKKFEWIIVNNNSTDNTDELVNQWIEEKRIADILYIKSEQNDGISYAMDIAIEKASGSLFFKVDDDDILRGDAIEQIIKYEKTITDRSKYAGVSGLRCRTDGSAIGKEWKHKKDYVDATNMERKKYGLNGDKAEAYYTEVLKKFIPSFPQNIGPTFSFEGILWNRIAHSGLKMRWFKEKIYICEYLPDGVTSNYYEGCKNAFLAYSYMVNEYKSYKEVAFLERFMNVSKYFAVAFAKGINRKKLPSHFLWNQRWLWLAYVYGWIIYQMRMLLKPKKYKNTEKK